MPLQNHFRKLIWTSLQHAASPPCCLQKIGLLARRRCMGKTQHAASLPCLARIPPPKHFSHGLNKLRTSISSFLAVLDVGFRYSPCWFLSFWNLLQVANPR